MSIVSTSPVSSRENSLRPKSLTRLKPERVQLGLRKLPKARRINTLG
jgi:hypothetical protein